MIKKEKSKKYKNPHILNPSDEPVDLVGSMVDVYKKAPENDATIVDINQSANDKIWRDICDFIEDERARYEDVFFVSILDVLDIVFEKSHDFKMFSQNSCPYPLYRQSVYRCWAKSGDKEFLWVVPQRKKARNMRKHWKEVPPRDSELLEFVMKFYDGTLKKLSDQINKELGASNGSN